ncbi:MAG: PilZ domain-containing protein [Bryobacteraceae bacterium]
MPVQNAKPVRKDERRPFECPVQVSWQTRFGEVKTLRAKCLDLSRQGARILCDQPIDLRANVYLQASAQGLMGNATVRYCRHIGMKYAIGLLFSAATSQADEGRKRCLSESQPGAERQ